MLAPVYGFSQPATAPDLQSCEADKVQALVGQPYSAELAEQARRDAGASKIRKIEPGGAYTMELDPTRLNIEVDQRGFVTGLRCG